MAFNNHTLQSEQNTTIGFVRVELVTERLEGAAGEQIADLGLPAARHRIAQKIRHLARGAFGGLQRDVAAETFRHDHVSRARADPVALDEADIVEFGQVHRTELFRRLANLFAALDLLNPDIEQADGRTLQAEQHARHRAAHDCERHQMMRITADAGAEIEYDGIAARRRPYTGNGRPVDPRHVCRWTLAIAISAPVLPAETATSASPRFTASIASPIEEFFAARSAWLGLSCLSP